ncbi:hypothetical protein M3Y96_01123300 [Aphelenchoides besseyi]|nr:hypothetical protein M3Y96_01123300 [Aphelenchoides besseyi]
MPSIQHANFVFCRQGGRLRLLFLMLFGLSLICVSFNTTQRSLLDDFTFPPPKFKSSSEIPLISTNQTTMFHSTLKTSDLLNDQPDGQPQCPTIDQISTFVKHLPKSRLLIENLQEEEVQLVHQDIQPGGEWKPADCRARDRVAIIIPYRNRKSHLTRLLDFLIPILKRQLLDFRIIVTEQIGNDLFNKGRIMNAAFKLAQSMGVDCTIFHDVDMFPQDDRIPYTCPSTSRHVRHLGAYVDTLGYFLLSKELVGGVLAIKLEDYLNVNGFSNLFYGWGGEDDELGKRFTHANYTIERLDPNVARYMMLKHVKRKRISPSLIVKLVESASARWQRDGVNETDKWRVIKTEKRPLYYHMFVDVGKSPEDLRRLTLFPYRNGNRLRLLLFLAFAFGLLYILVLNSAVPSKSLLTNYDPQPSLLNVSSVESSQKSLAYESLVFDSNDIGNESSIFNFSSKVTNIFANLPLCPAISNITNFVKHLPQATLLIEDLQEEEVAQSHKDIQPGGEWKPANCRARDRVAIIIPYRDRKSHLTRLVDFLIPILKHQLLDFRFIVTEQFGDDLFNKGRIMNAAFKLAQSMGVGCTIFHDVDMFPQDDRTPYNCPESPRHLGAFVSNLGYQLWYKEIVGGALAITIEDYLAVNGYSNLYWGWGGEDDDMGKRILSLNYTIERPDNEYARFSMLKHVKRKRTAPKLIYKLLDSAGTRWEHDGVNETGLWKVKRVERRPLYYHCLVDVGESPAYWRVT